MTFKNSFKTAFRGIRANKFRSLLSILGIVIGITAIILIMSLGEGAKNLILNQIQGMGSKTIIVLPGREPKGPADVAQVFSDSLKEKDFQALTKKTNVQTLGRIMPILFGGESASFRGETYRLTLFGGSELMSDIFDISVESGRFLTDDDVKGRAEVMVIGAKVREELFPDGNALGQKIKVKGRNLRVIGIIPRKGQVSFFNFDESAVIPYTTAQQYIFGIKYFHRFVIEADSEENIPQTVKEVEATLRNSHGISDPDKDDFHVETQADLANRLSVVTDTLTLFLGSVAAISLLVGGIGVMNIMLVSVTERTREIGLRKAIGATDRDILLQFLLEAITITGIGGITGILLGTGFAFLSSFILGRVVGLDWAFTFPTQGALLGFSVSTLVGLVFGLYPAQKASQKSPIEALRYE